MTRFLLLARNRLPHALVLAAGLMMVDYLRNGQVVVANKLSHFAASFEAFINWFLMAAVIVTIISACEVFLRPGWRRAIVQAVSLVTGPLVYAYWIGISPWLTVQYFRLGLDDLNALFMYIVWLGWAMAALLSGFYVAHGMARAAAAALRRAQLERERTQQRLLEARLQVLEAQVEPRFLFDALSRIQRLYEVDVTRADLVLDDLIAYLRAALPQQRERASTLGRELNLVEAYVRIASSAAHDIRRAGHAIESAYAPPMVLLPVVQLALAVAPDHPLAVRAGDEGARTAMRVEFDCDGLGDARGQIPSLRATMAVLFGAEGRVDVATGKGKTTVSVSWPSALPSGVAALKPQLA